MTTLQKTIVTATIAVLAGAGIYEARQASRLRDQVQTLNKQQAPLVEQIEQLKSEWSTTTNHLASLANELSKAERNNLELMKLRAEATRLRAPLDTTASMNHNFRPEKVTSDDPLGILNKFSPDLIRQVEMRVSNTIVQLDAALNLTPEQDQQMRAILMRQTAFADSTNGIRMVLGDDLLHSTMLPLTLEMVSLKDDSSPEQSADKQEAVSNLEKSIAAILSPDQLSAYELHKQDAQAKTAKELADGEVLEIQKSIELTLEQQRNAALALQNFWFGGVQIPSSLQRSELSSWLRNERQKTLGSILTPTQLAQYRQFLIQAERESRPEALSH